MRAPELPRLGARLAPKTRDLIFIPEAENVCMGSLVRSGNSGVYSIKGLRYGVNHRAAGTTTWVHTYTGSYRDW